MMIRHYFKISSSRYLPVTFNNADCTCRKLPVSPRRKNGTLPSSPSRRKWFVPFLYSYLPALFLSVFGLLALIIGSVAPINVTLIAELALLIVFSALCSILCTLLGQIIKSSLAFDALIPVILLFCLLYSPVLMDLGDFIPGYKVLSWLAPTKWYFALHNFIL